MNHRSLRTTLGLLLLLPLACETPGGLTPGPSVKQSPGETSGGPAAGDTVQGPSPGGAPGTDTASIHQEVGSVILRSLGGNTVHIRPASIRQTPSALVEFDQLGTTGQTAMTFTITVPKGLNFEVSDGAGRPDSALQLKTGKNEVKLVREGTGVRFQVVNASNTKKTSRENPHSPLPATATPRVQAERVGDDSKRVRIWATLGDLRSSFILTQKP